MQSVAGSARTLRSGTSRDSIDHLATRRLQAPPAESQPGAYTTSKKPTRSDQLSRSAGRSLLSIFRPTTVGALQVQVLDHGNQHGSTVRTPHHLEIRENPELGTDAAGPSRVSVSGQKSSTMRKTACDGNAAVTRGRQARSLGLPESYRRPSPMIERLRRPHASRLSSGSAHPRAVDRRSHAIIPDRDRSLQAQCRRTALPVRPVSTSITNDPTSSGSIDVASVINPEHRHGSLALIDPIQDAVATSSCAVDASELVT